MVIWVLHSLSLHSACSWCHGLRAMLTASQDPSCSGCSFCITRTLTYVKSLLKFSFKNINPSYLTKTAAGLLPLDPPSHFIFLNGDCYRLVQLLRSVWLSARLWTAAHQASLSFIISWSFLKLMYIESMMPSNHLILCCPLSLQFSIFPSIRVFFSENYLSISISPSNEYSGSISFRIDWLDLLAVHGTLRSLL